MKGKTYAEIYGPERALLESTKRKEAHRRRVNRLPIQSHGDDCFYEEWRAAVLKKTEGRCSFCGTIHWMEAHHLKPWSLFPELRLVVENGLGLCHKHHKEFHRFAGGVPREEFRTEDSVLQVLVTLYLERA